MRTLRLARCLGFGVMIAASLGFEPLDNCKLCHQTAPVPAGHAAVESVSWPVCATCHGLAPDATELNQVLVGMHATHVRKLSFDCAVCHAFSGSDERAAASQRLDRMLDQAATD